ncbi:sulfite exporter TauE/SafE family protein [Pandoraea terrigena]|uniref:Probable membrane transporter protein n=1 Tax=Pandoraea terrigena TaxID=2508292 RepID=A0A5E4XSX2_9BURK|nr:sulfite exporter TauE/SafE family protein [Pandoraea terrigena]VVE39477.1 membrane protein [Pandoraea terrigena]
MIEATFVLAGAVTGFVVGVTGIGGGALMTPILLLIFGVAPTTAIATDLWFAAITKLVGARIHYRAGQVDWQVVKRLWVGSLPVSLGVVLLVSAGGVVVKAEWLTNIVIGVVMLTAFGLIFAPRLFAAARSRRLSNPDRFKAMQPTLTVLVGATLGVCVALTSVGAGALGTVMLMNLYPLRMTPHRLIATDLVHAIPLAVVAGTGYLLAGAVDWRMLASLLVGSIPAVIVGSRLAGRMPGRWLQVALALVLLSTGLKVLI